MNRILHLLLIASLLPAAAGCEGPRAEAGSAAGEASATNEAATQEGGERSAAGRRSDDPGDLGTAGRDAVVAFVGTSLTAGLGLLDPDDRFTARIQELADSAGLPVRVVNAGVSGETSAGGLRRMDWVLREPMDVLVVELGANDGLRGQDPVALEENLRAVVHRARDRYPDVRIVLAGMEAPPNMGPRYTEAFRNVYPRVAEEVGARLVPFLLEGVAGHPGLNQADGIHPNPEGHRRIARDVIWPVLEPVLREILGEAAGMTAGGAP